VVICAAVPGVAVTETPRRQPPPVVLGRPTPRPTGAPALVNVTVIVPAALVSNERLLAPPGASTADQDSVVGNVVGVVVVLGTFCPQPAVIPTKHASAIHFIALMGA
jgi:hypothetical protein